MLIRDAHLYVTILDAHYVKMLILVVCSKKDAQTRCSYKMLMLLICSFWMLMVDTHVDAHAAKMLIQLIPACHSELGNRTRCTPILCQIDVGVFLELHKVHYVLCANFSACGIDNLSISILWVYPQTLWVFDAFATPHTRSGNHQPDFLGWRMDLHPV